MFRERIFEETGIMIPILPADDAFVRVIYSLSMGPYRLFRGCLTAALQRRRELVEQATENPGLFENFNHFYRMCHQRPEQLDIHYKYLPEKPNDYDALTEYGDFPDGGKKKYLYN